MQTTTCPESKRITRLFACLCWLSAMESLESLEPRKGAPGEEKELSSVELWPRAKRRFENLKTKRSGCGGPFGLQRSTSQSYLGIPRDKDFRYPRPGIPPSCSEKRARTCKYTESVVRRLQGLRLNSFWTKHARYCKLPSAAILGVDLLSTFRNQPTASLGPTCASIERR